MNPKLTADHLRRRAIVYIRQSKPEQVIHHRESKLRQYSLADQARAMGFVDVVTIDDGDQREDKGFPLLPPAVIPQDVPGRLLKSAAALAKGCWVNLSECELSECERGGNSADCYRNLNPQTLQFPVRTWNPG